MYLPAEGPLFPSFFPWSDGHQLCPAELKVPSHEARKEHGSTSLPELQSSLSQQHFQRHQRQLPGQRTQLDTAAAQHGADNQWRKGEMWQK